MLERDARFDGYRVRSRIGEGAVAAVYEVVHETLGSVHALKVLEVAAPEARRRLMLEGRAQARVRHPNLVGVTDVIRVGESPALVLEYVDGPTLAEWLATGRPALGDALAVFRGIVRGVEAAHAAGLVHRDLKPANVLLARTPSGLVPKVSDFGLAKILDATDPELSDHDIRGTPQYMAPEQHQGRRDVDERADLFALGVLLYELVTGRRPFDGPDLLAIAQAACAGRFTPPEEVVADLPRPVLDAIRGLLQVDRNRRIATCGELLVRLDGRAGRARPSFDTLALEQLPAAPLTPRPRRERTPTRAPARRAADGGWGQRIVVGAAILSVVVVIAIAIALSIAAPPSPVREAPPTPAAPASGGTVAP